MRRGRQGEKKGKERSEVFCTPCNLHHPNNSWKSLFRYLQYPTTLLVRYHLVIFCLLRKLSNKIAVYPRSDFRSFACKIVRAYRIFTSPLFSPLRPIPSTPATHNYYAMSNPSSPRFLSTSSFLTPSFFVSILHNYSYS